ncbi:MAG: hypothetical protein CMF62_03510 [Magnetococcales bacterium]|nr:hypothetical protein [Magnetococcales bacterium]
MNSADIVLNREDNYQVVVKFRKGNFKKNQIGISGKKFFKESDQDAINRILNYKFGLEVRSGTSIDSFGTRSVYPDRENMIHNIYSISPNSIKTVDRQNFTGKYNKYKRIHFMICGDHDELLQTFSNCSSSFDKNYIEGIYIIRDHDVTSQVTDYLKLFEKKLLVASQVTKGDMSPRCWSSVVDEMGDFEKKNPQGAKNFVFRTKETDKLTSFNRSVLVF